MLGKLKISLITNIVNSHGVYVQTKTETTVRCENDSQDLLVRELFRQMVARFRKFPVQVSDYEYLEKSSDYENSYETLVTIVVNGRNRSSILNEITVCYREWVKSGKNSVELFQIQTK